nr:peptidoglycan DD-metalloendopeptidase family protein [Pedobacter panaciterrae]
MKQPIDLIAALNQGDVVIGKVVDFDAAHDLLYSLDLTTENKELTDDVLNDTDLFSNWVEDKLRLNNCRYGIGGYNEHRSIYARSAHFDATEEPRRLHLGVDIWGAVGTPVYNFHDAIVHSFKFNNNFGDYGATIILKYILGDIVMHALYGHLSLKSLDGLEEGMFISEGQQFATFGAKEENGYWPPHLHFQLIFNMQTLKGDYPGVCQYTKRDIYLKNCPDPALILTHTF